MKKNLKISNNLLQTFSISVLLFYSSIVIAVDEIFPLTSNTTGGIGLITTPTARMSNDGEFSFGLSKDVPYSRLYSKMQFFPWLETVVRYTEGTYQPYQIGLAQTWKDKGIDLKIRLLQESDNFPELSLGIDDIGGTGAFSSEYLVASKRYNNFDFTLGLGWGYLNGPKHISNPLQFVSNFLQDKLSKEDSAFGGALNLGKLFNGDDASFFGGVEYYTSITNLSLKVEYDSSDYEPIAGLETNYFEEGNLFEYDSRINYALNYRLNLGTRDKVDFSIGLVRGNTLYANVNIHSNLNEEIKKKFIAPTEIINIPYLEPYKQLTSDWQEYLSNTIMWQMGNVGFVTHKLIFKENELQAEISQGRFQNTVQAIDLASRILANNSPKNINKITVINIDQGIETLRASIPRKDLVQSVSNGPLDERLLQFNQIQNIENIKKDEIIVHNEYLYPNFYWEIKPHALGTLQHQERFYFWQLEALIHTEYSIKQGLYFTTDIGINIANNYEDYYYHIPDGKLHHVRQDRRLYLTEGETGLRKMALDYVFQVSPNINGKMQFGYLEWMYGGFGGEMLYTPTNKRWGVGIDAYWVKQREFDQKFSFQDYSTVTGFLSYYQDIPFYNMRLKASVGKFLGKDEGIQIDISRRFNSGARVGGIVSLTDCDAACVGEGSFNKWIYFELPMDMFYIQSNTRSKTGYAWSPLTKDAGTKVESGNLYNLVLNATDEVDSLRQTPWSLKKIISGFSTKKHSRT